MPLPSLTLGDLQLTVLSGGTLWIDGGNMFGVVPRVMWEKACPPDDRNRILLDTNCLLVRTPDSLGLIDTGYGDKSAAKVRERHALEDGFPLGRSLAAANVTAEQIDWVILTHLHFDHAGGCTMRDSDGRLTPTFSNAKHFIQRTEWDDATANRPELAGNYFPDDFVPLREAGLVQLVDETADVAPGISTRRTNGHTRGHQIVTLTSGGQTAWYLGDLCPLSPHVRTFWSMAYDQFPLTVRVTKPVILGEIADRKSMAIFGHDPHTPFARIRRDERTEWAVDAVIN